MTCTILNAHESQLTSLLNDAQYVLNPLSDIIVSYFVEPLVLVWQRPSDWSMPKKDMHAISHMGPMNREEYEVYITQAYQKVEWNKCVWVSVWIEIDGLLQNYRICQRIMHRLNCLFNYWVPRVTEKLHKKEIGPLTI
jgi:hypothetical protein